jgi:hypothetical protein
VPNPWAHRAARRLCAAAVVTLFLAPLSAHEVIVEQRVEMTLAPGGDHLTVTLHVPAALSGDRELPAVLAGGDATAIDARLRIVAADLAHNLDIEQGDTSLPAPAIVARRGADGASIDIALRYATVDETPFSARLNAFTTTATSAPVRTDARFRTPSGRIDLISVTGPASRVVFDPPAPSVLQQFAGRGLRALADGGDQWLWLVCVLLLARRAPSALVLFASVAAAQAVAIVATTVVSTVAPATIATWLPAAGLLAASAVAMMAMQNVARARLRLVIAVTVAFGAMNGLDFGDTITGATQFAGGHRGMALAVFTAVVLAGELWLGTLGWMVRRWLDEQGISERGIAILGSAFVAHDALHRAFSRADVLTQSGSFGGERAIEWVTLAWAGAVLLVGIANAIAGTPQEAPAS